MTKEMLLRSRHGDDAKDMGTSKSLGLCQRHSGYAIGIGTVLKVCWA